MKRIDVLPKSRRWMLLTIFLLTLGLLKTFADRKPHHAAQPSPSLPTPTINSPNIPADVANPPSITTFDDYSWRAFLAMVWPVQQGQRGVPDATQTVDGPGPRVFETYKALWEVFHEDGSAPAGWNQYDPPKWNPCSMQATFGDIELASFSKFSNLGQAGVGSLVGPLPTQQGTYARFMTGFNQTEFDQIQANAWYLLNNLPKSPMTLKFNDGSVDVKSAWIDMTGIAHPERYYTRMASVQDPKTGVCSPLLVGLVGLHIVQKTPTRPQWIWSSFEQVDNVPPTGTTAPGPYSFNDGTSTAQPRRNPNQLLPGQTPPVTEPPLVFNVQRLLPMNSSTQQTNALYQAALRQANPNTVWQYYQLVMTQWPTPGNSPNNPATPGFTIPGTTTPKDPMTCFANVTMETFDQTRIQTGCMNCHYATAAQVPTPTPGQINTDFLWSLHDHAGPNPAVPNLIQSKNASRLMTSKDVSFQRLKSLLQLPQLPVKATAKKSLPKSK